MMTISDYLNVLEIASDEDLLLELVERQKRLKILLSLIKHYFLNAI